MANTFKNYVNADVGTTPVTVITASTATTVIGMSLANKTASPVTISAYITVGGSDYYIVKDATVPVGGSLVTVGAEQKLVLETGDALKAVSSAAASIDVIASVLELA